MIEAMPNRVKLKNHVYFGVVADGILFDAGDASFVLKDTSTYPVVEKLIALIDAGNPVATILERAPPKLADFFGKILSLLAEHGMLLTLEADAPSAEALAAHTASNELRKFLEDRIDGRSVGLALRRWCDTEVVVVGSGRALLSAVRALADSGCAKLTVVPDGGSTDGTEALQDDIASAHSLRFGIGAMHDAERLIDAAGLLLYVSDDAVPTTVMRIERALKANRIAGAIGAVFDARACVLPAAQPGHPGVADLLHWLAPQGRDAASLGPIAMTLLGCVAAQAAICRFFGVEATTAGAQVAIVTPSLEVDYCMLVAAAKTEPTPPALVHPAKHQTPERVLMPFEHIKYALEPWFDPVLGPFSVVADDRIEQVPLLQYPIRVRSASDPGIVVTVIGWGLEHGAAVVHGLAQACEALAHSFDQDGVVLVCEFDEESWKRRALAYAVATSDEMAKRNHWAWVDLEQLPAGPLRVLHSLLRFHAPDGIAVQIQWCGSGDAFIVRVLRAGSLLCSVIAAAPLAALAEGLGQACSMFQLQQLQAARFCRDPAVPAPNDAAQVADWRDALLAAQTGTAREVQFHRLAAPGFPPAVFCGHANLQASAGTQ